jgi:hypothetical protein
MCAGIASPGTLREVLRGYTGDRRAPQLIGDDEVVKAGPLPPLTGKAFTLSGQRLSATHRTSHSAAAQHDRSAEYWSTYVPNAAYLTQRGGTFLFDGQGNLLYEHRDRGVLGFAATMATPSPFRRPCSGGE